ncbi:class I SAM-dependent methyltransferase [Flavobacteriaceae bacterium 3-367]
MDDAIILDKPVIYEEIQQKCEEIGFSMPSDMHVGAFLKALISAKPQSHFLELGTGIGLSLSWMVDGMDKDSRLITVDNDEGLTAIARGYFGKDQRVTIVCSDGTEWIKGYQGQKFDLVFADAWPGKYSEIEEVLDLVNLGGFYVIDDMKEQPNWPKGHRKHVDGLIAYLEARTDFNLIKMNWSTGLIVAVRKNTNKTNV